MASAVISNSVLKSKFRGCMIGGLLGDCLGAPYEDETFFLVPKEDLSKFMDSLMSGEYKKVLPHTDDTRMTIALVSSLVDKGEANANDIAKKFVEEYNSQPGRGYGVHVRYVFMALKKSNCKDIFLPAQKQFNGSGSWGNGAAMRVAPIALFGNSRSEEYIMNAAKDCSLITHAHRNGYNGAILQCLAVNLALKLDSSQELDPVWFIDCLLEKMKNVETKVKPYCESLYKMKEYFHGKQDNISTKEIAEIIGNGDDVSALKSVPPAIYSFLRGMKPFKDYFQNSNPFLRTIFYAVSLGGDTDTIASMAGSIAGAYYGEDIIPKEIQKKCEMIDEIISLADKLFDTAYKKE